GRVLSLLMVLLGTLYPLGSVLQGAIADRIGLRATTAGAGSPLGALLLFCPALRPPPARALGCPPAAGPAGGAEAPAPAAGRRDWSRPPGRQTRRLGQR